MKKYLAIVAITSTVSMSVMAQQQTSSLTTSDINNLFDVSKLENIQALELSSQEMKDTQGALAPWIIGGAVGGISGGAMYSYGVWRGNYQWNTTRFLGNVGTGAVIGGTFGAAGAAAGGGLSVGANVWRVNSFSTNFGANSIWRR
ncbi:hypothetical protein ACWB3A_09780 [Acinetobacter baumannii]|uniref:hypothetical protein n=1 Tax=Acinetobacter baumannii TaxID=470 RepID=UPI00124537E6|nr:hypothetical protein [Acinetobacter baumannii]MCR0012455.1 hypothetical protein [Acinetobacter baumannii]MDN8172992.1 hypothetical protein [Acinetobacter baumannii]MDQ8939252.1 hypothetical protein [Acinetobacter baumannii]MDQ9850857.1 hypothetical protein [Acinetobacter baumannii]MDQ9999298.1 hypothetical protein [Acinetobacter baumannii]